MRTGLIAILTALLATACSTVPSGWKTADPVRVEAVKTSAAFLFGDISEGPSPDQSVVQMAANEMATDYLLQPHEVDKGVRAAHAIAYGQEWAEKNARDLTGKRTLAAVARSALGLDIVAASDAELLVGVLEAALSAK